MKIFKIAKSVIQAYHGSSISFQRFDRQHSAEGVFWFSENLDSIKNQESGAVSNKYIASVELLVEKTAGWEEYEKYYLQQIEESGFDSIKLDENWVIFDPNRIKIKEWFRRKQDGGYENI